ncbi:MAG: hypothetical protein H0Z39_08665 [Peptococcaceae bacterium]|nr:hypothetical protein [Peptococcaceae bacterium]
MTVLLAAIGADLLEEALQISRRQPVVVFGTMDGAVLRRLGTDRPQVYFYETG